MTLKVKLFKSKTCPHCQQQLPLYKEVMDAYADKIESEIIDIGEDITPAVDNGVMGVPTTIILKDGKEAKRFVGIVSKENLAAEIKELL